MKLREFGLGHAEAGTLELQFNRTAKVVTEAYNSHLPTFVTTRGTAKVFVMAWNAVPEDYPRWRQPEPDGRDGDDVDEMNVEWNIDRFRKASIIERRALLLELLHGSVVELAAARSWPTDSFEQAYALVVESGVQARWRSAEKRSPDRRLKASVLGWVDESGASFKLVVDDKNGERVFESQEHSVRMAEINELKLRCHSIRWLGSSAVEISARAYRGLSDPAYGPLRIQVAESPSA